MTVETTPLKGVITCHTFLFYKAFLSSLRCYVLLFFYLINAVFFIDCAVFWDKTVIFAV